jgi:DNA-binding response OmpR family regulator
MQTMSQSATVASVVRNDPSESAFRKKGLLLIDDDEAFCRLVKAAADARGIPMTCYASLEQMPSLGALGDYDLAILDYNLRAFTGLEIAEYVDVFFDQLPVLIVSIDNLENNSAERWPACVRKFVNKAFGPFAIVQRALAVFEEAQADYFVRSTRRMAARVH